MVGTHDGFPPPPEVWQVPLTHVSLLLQVLTQESLFSSYSSQAPHVGVDPPQMSPESREP
jgi:hypothetical protein